MLKLTPGEVVELPVDQLGIEVLKDLVATGQWNEYNYLLAAAEAYRDQPGASQAIAEAMAWLRARALIARTLGQTADAAIFVTRAGKRVLLEGLVSYSAADKLQGGLHPLIETFARPQFMIGKYELAVFDSLKAIEVRVRALGKFADSDIGVDLMNRAFGPTGQLRDPTAVSGEQEATRGLFAGAYGLLRNPPGHRVVNYDDVQEAAEGVHTASMLMRILDRIEKRLRAKTP